MLWVVSLLTLGRFGRAKIPQKEASGCLAILSVLSFSPLWLPLAVLVVSLARFGIGGVGMGPSATDMLLLFAFTWPAAFPLTLAVRLLHNRSRIVAYVCGALLGAGAVYGVIVGGLLGPVGVIGYALAASVPAWIVLGVLAIARGGGANRQASQA